MQNLRCPTASAASQRSITTQSRRAQCRPRAAATAATLAVPVADSFTGAEQDAWAIVRLGGTQQFVEVGKSLAVRTTNLKAQVVGSVVRFSDVLAAKVQGRVSRGGPHVLVEGRVLDEFQGPAVPLPSTLQLQQQLQQPEQLEVLEPVQLTQVLITRIDVDAPDTSSVHLTPAAHAQQQQQ